jgi:exonuclease VII small subunit
MKTFLETMIILEPRNRHIVFVDDDIANRDEFLREYLLSHEGNIRPQVPSGTIADYIVIPVKINGPEDLACRNLETERHVNEYITQNINKHTEAGYDPEDMTTSPFFGIVTYLYLDVLKQARYKKESEGDRAVAFISKIISIILLLLTFTGIVGGIGEGISALKKGVKKLSKLSKVADSAGTVKLAKKQDELVEITRELETAADSLDDAIEAAADADNILSTIVEKTQESAESLIGLWQEAETYKALVASAQDTYYGIRSLRAATSSAAKHLDDISIVGKSLGKKSSEVIDSVTTVTLPRQTLKDGDVISKLPGNLTKSSKATTLKIDLPERVSLHPLTDMKGPERAAIETIIQKKSITPPKDTSVSLKDGMIPEKPKVTASEPVTDESLEFIRSGIANYDEVMKASTDSLKTHYFAKRALFQPTTMRADTVKNFHDRLVSLKKQLDAAKDSATKLSIRADMMKETQLLASTLNKPPFNASLSLTSVSVTRNSKKL